MSGVIYLVHFDSNRVPQACKKVKSQRVAYAFSGLWCYEPVSPELYAEIKTQLKVRKTATTKANRKAKRGRTS